MSDTLSPKVNALTNLEIVTLAVYLLGGKTNAIDTEYVAKKAAELAPGRYNWRHYPEQINIHIIGAFLADAKKPKNGAYLSGSINTGWMLTEVGSVFASRNIERLEGSDLSQLRKSQGEKKWLKQERARLLASDAFRKLCSPNSEEVSLSEVASFFRVDEYVKGTARERKITRIVNAFRDDPQLCEAVITLRHLLLEMCDQDG